MSTEDPFALGELTRKLDAQWWPQIRSYTITHIGSNMYFITKDDRVFYFGGTWQTQPPRTMVYSKPSEIIELRHKSVIDIVHGFNHVVALTAGGDVHTWGQNQRGQLGYVSEDCTQPSIIPTLVFESREEQIVAIASGAWHSMALTRAGDVYAWGFNWYGQLGVGNNLNQTIPVKIAQLGGRVIKICAGGCHSVALRDDGHVLTWGRNYYGQLGTRNYEGNVSPVDITQHLQGERVVDIGCGVRHTVLLTASGQVYSFGSNEHLQLGTELINRGCSTPVRFDVSHLPEERIKAIRVSASMSIAQSANTDLCYVWGQVNCNQASMSTIMVTPFKEMEEAIRFYSKDESTTAMLHVPEARDSVSRQVATSFNDRESSDLELQIDNRSLFVHRAILRIRSAYLNGLLSSRWLNENCIELSSNYSYEAYCAFIRFLYTDTIDIANDFLVELLELSHSFLQHNLMLQCSHLLLNNLGVEMACRLYQLAHLFNLAELDQHVRRFINEHRTQVEATEGWRNLSEVLKQSL